MAKKKNKRTPLTFSRVAKIIAIGVICAVLILATVARVWHYITKHLN